MQRTAREVAEFLGARLDGDPEAPISGIAGPEHARPDDLVFADSPRHAARAAGSAAVCVLAPQEIALPGKTRLVVAAPKLAFAKAAAWLRPPAPVAVGLHPTALVASSARLAPDVAVGPYAVIEDEVEIGAGSQIGALCVLRRGTRLGGGCRLHPRVTLYPGVRLGDRVELHSGVVIGSDGFGYVFGEGRQWKFPQIGGVEIGDDVEIGANTTVDGGALDATRLGAGVKLDNLVQIGHAVRVGEHTVISAQTGISGSSVIGRNCTIGGQVGMGDHATIEDGAVCGSQAGIASRKVIRSGQVVWGTPARPLEKVKQLNALFGRLPSLVERLRRLEQRLGSSGETQAP